MSNHWNPKQEIPPPTTSKLKDAQRKATQPKLQDDMGLAWFMRSKVKDIEPMRHSDMLPSGVDETPNRAPFQTTFGFDC